MCAASPAPCESPAAGDELAGFTHPGREPGRFGLSRYEDHLLEGVGGGAVSPLVAGPGDPWAGALPGYRSAGRAVAGRSPFFTFPRG